MSRSVSLGRIIAAALVSTAVTGSFVGMNRRAREANDADLHRIKFDPVREEQIASELLARDGSKKRHQPKRKAQRPNRAQRRKA